ncbi:lipopolysaccharide biosynthesis protein [Bacteroides graminisolvens]|uniref:lipopolysaccharide biosynthesis protein n=1 Tax=Bacteroides graminisolvens TaxID=477666 RepID=UPI00240A576D|nr:lipopolysaccharide biosynthesis protein [Bacteroides graminisolvens]
MNASISSNKRIMKNTMLLYLRMLFTMGVALYTSRIILNVLGISDYGIYNVVGGVVTIFGVINAAMATASQRFITFELGGGNINKLKIVFCTSLNIHILISLVIFIIAETIGLWFFYTQLNIPIGRIGAAFWVYQFSVLTTMVMMITVPYNAVIIAHERMSAFAYISILEVVLKLLIVWALTVFGIDKLILYVVLLFIVQMIIQVVYVFYCRLFFKETKFQLLWDGLLFKKMSAFAGWQLFGCTAGVAYTQGLNILLNIFFGPAVNAARAVAVQVQNAIQNFSLNFQQAINPQITKSYAINDQERLSVLINASSKYSFFLVFFLSLPVLIETQYILSFWLGIVPEHTANFIRIMLVVMMIDVTANPLITAAAATGRIKTYQMVVGGILLLILPISYLFLKLGYNPEIVFLVHFGMVICAQIARLFMLRKMISFSIRRYFKEVALRSLIVGSISIVLPLVVSEYLNSSFASFMIVCLICILSTSCSIYFFGLQKNEQHFAKEKVSQLYYKLKK